MEVMTSSRDQLTAIATMRSKPPVARHGSLNLALTVASWLSVAVLGVPTTTASPINLFPWVTTWSGSPQPADPALTGNVNLNNQTLRLIVHTSLGGPQMRVRISNAFGTQPLLIGDAHVAVPSSSTSAIVVSTDQPLTFGGQPTVTIPAGSVILSDPLNWQVPPLSDIAISLYLPNATANTVLTEHIYAEQISYVSPTGTGDLCGSGSIPSAIPSPSWYFLSAVEVVSHFPAQTVVVLGDSITDGFGSTIDANHRWTDYLAARLANVLPFLPLGIANQGISGNRVLNDVTGPNALARFDRDVLGQAAVGYVIVEEGLNDVIQGTFSPVSPADVVTANQIIAGLTQLIQRGHDQGLKVVGATLTPYGGSAYYTSTGETERQTVNQFIRTGGAFDAVVDFDQAIRDPNNPNQILATYDAGDHLHPNDAGDQAMANAFNLLLFLNFIH
jgi:lysophospholipase L1-like esterase